MTRATRAAVLATIATITSAWPALDEKLQSYPSIHARETAKIKAGDAKTAKYILRAALNAELRAAFKEDPSSLSADDRARAEQLLARDARKAAKKAARRVSSETPSPGTA